jgi:hypothetical protein
MVREAWLDPDNPWHDPHRQEPEEDLLPGALALEREMQERAEDERERQRNAWLWAKYAHRLTADGGIIR